MDADNLVWHDGVLNSIVLTMEKKRTALVLKVSLPEKLLSSTRTAYVVKIEAPSRLTLNVDLNALQDNSKAGNITDVKIVKGKSVKFFLLLADGHIEVIGRSASVIQAAAED